MAGWFLMEWTVKLDVRYLGGHLDSTLGARATTLGYRIAAAVHRVPSVAVLPVDFCGKLRILRTMHIPAALHGAEASLVSLSGLRELRSAFGRAALSGGLRLAGKNLYQKITRTILQEKVTIHCNIAIWYTHLFLCLEQ